MSVTLLVMVKNEFIQIKKNEFIQIKKEKEKKNEFIFFFLEIFNNIIYCD